MKRVKKTHWLRNTLLVLIACAIAGTCLSIVLFMKDSGSATCAEASIQLSYDGAASGLGPNGTRFDISSIFCRDVIDEGLKASGLENRYTVEDISGKLSIQGEYPSDINNQMTNYDSILDFSSTHTVSLNSYHPTLFTVRLSNDFDKHISQADLEKLLNSIMLSAKTYFNKVCTVSPENPPFEFTLSEYDYSQQLIILSRSLNRTRSYASSLYEDNNTFTSDGMGFNDIVIQLDNLIDNVIDPMKGDIIISALTKDAERLRMQYEYEYQSLIVEEKEQKQCLQDLDNLIASYEKNQIIYLSSGESWTKIDGNSSKPYDALVVEWEKIADGIAEIEQNIELYKQQMIDMDQYAATADGQENAAKEAAANKMAQMGANIARVQEQYQAVMGSFSELIQAYNTQILNDSTVQFTQSRYKTPTLLSTSFVVMTIKTAGPICAVGFIVCLALIIRSRRKELKALMPTE